MALLDELYVVPGQRGRGVDATLQKAAEAAVRERGGGLVEINVDGDDADARRFYDATGTPIVIQGKGSRSPTTTAILLHRTDQALRSFPHTYLGVNADGRGLRGERGARWQLAALVAVGCARGDLRPTCRAQQDLPSCSRGYRSSR